jgi:hypothetical protein
MPPKQNKKRLRNLNQYKNMTDEEFESLWENYKEKPEVDIESRINLTMEEFAKNYDLRDMNANDTLALRELARIYVHLEDLGRMEQSAIEDGEVAKIGSLSRIKKEYLDNASRIQIDLNITRKSRQSAEGEELSTYLPAYSKES